MSLFILKNFMVMIIVVVLCVKMMLVCIFFFMIGKLFLVRICIGI